ncbi:alpha/beta fold hydrolase [Mycobacterium sp. ITM-2016-00317]|nr:alpha/beta fold hydrolase [Mycobacterium sp. ITM-2016-00317]WNG87684.1 alpha/beta fold hydrolase [Mycobacterium sp. ITM-2016-00317]
MARDMVGLRKLIPLLSATHRVFAVDLRGFGDSSAGDGAYDEATSAEDMHHLVEHLGAGPVHVLCQDISGGLGFRFAATHPEDVLSFTAIETTLAGFGLESLADVNNGGSWHVGFLGPPGIPGMLLAGHERELIADWAYPTMTIVKNAITEGDIDRRSQTSTNLPSSTLYSVNSLTLTCRPLASRPRNVPRAT